ncbi:unnamed protein product [Gongylonema pulchrum]|uniref:Sushi domain-containing protein n=1 Tax=Gongylonema pulchrum TaxID=637853 RepID=A0A183DUN5_9BILA|nr:unnamed protein product [Gongylonema pulchrum]
MFCIPEFGAEYGNCLSDYPSPGNGIVVYSNGAIRPPYPAMTTANIRCGFGYVPTGTVAAVCQNGQWTPSTPTKCIRSGGAG